VQFKIIISTSHNVPHFDTSPNFTLTGSV